MPATTITINSPQRNGLYELVRNHLGSVGDLWDALEGDKDFATAAGLGLEFGEDFELLEDIGWGEDEGRESFELTMPVHDLMELLKRSMTKPSRCSSERGPSDMPENRIGRPRSATCLASMPARRCWSSLPAG